MNFNAHCRYQSALELIRVDEQSHGLDGKSVPSSTRHCEDRGVFDHVCRALRIRNVDLEAWVIDLDERWQTYLIMTLFWLVKAESMVDRRHRGHHVQCL